MKITYTLTKNSTKNCCHQSCSFWLKYAPNRLSAGASLAPDPTGRAYSVPPDSL